jgi:hypothetical protein
MKGHKVPVVLTALVHGLGERSHQHGVAGRQAGTSQRMAA